MSPSFTSLPSVLVGPLPPWASLALLIAAALLALRLLYFALLPDPEEPRTASRVLAGAIAAACIAGIVVKVVCYGWM